MYLQIIGSFCAALFFYNSGIAQQSVTGSQELQLNLEQFPDTGNQTDDETRTDKLELNLEQFENSDQTDSAPANPDGELKLNLEQFDTTGKSQSDDLELNLDQFESNNQSPAENKVQAAGNELELNLDKFDNNNKPVTQINNTGSRSARVEKLLAPKATICLFLSALFCCSWRFSLFFPVEEKEGSTRVLFTVHALPTFIEQLLPQ